MLIFKTLSWGNWFSYGDNNHIDLQKNQLTQIVGQNGHGKSSIALILEETLFNKNSKNIKKADILNRNIRAKNCWSRLVFEKDNIQYELSVTRSSTTQIQLLKNSTDISGHTPTQTYKILESILGFDHKTFAQLIYLSSANSLEFLTATDTNRKKFLIELLDLGVYTQYHDSVKTALVSVQSSVDTLQGKYQAHQEWLNSTDISTLKTKPLLEVPEQPIKQLDELAQLKSSVANLDASNKAIIQNNKYKELREDIILRPLGDKPVFDFREADNELARQNQISTSAQKLVDKLNQLGAKCPTCEQAVDQKQVAYIKEAADKERLEAKQTIEHVRNLVSKAKKKLEDWNSISESYKLYEEYNSLYNENLPKVTTDLKDLQANIKNLSTLVEDTQNAIKHATKANQDILVKNAKVELILEQLTTRTQQLSDISEQLEQVKEQANSLEVLVKTFSPSGVVAYKIESLIKDLEAATNSYLLELSQGRFQLGFRIEKGDKLNVVISDNGKDIDILALSSGERARVNTAALLGIRKLMQGISNNRCNLLILDETIENLDVEGKEKLVETLLQEPYLNTFIISHGFQHPLLEKLHVIKTNNISKVE